MVLSLSVNIYFSLILKGGQKFSLSSFLFFSLYGWIHLIELFTMNKDNDMKMGNHEGYLGIHSYSVMIFIKKKNRLQSW